MRTITTYTLAVPGRPISANARIHYRKWAEETAYWRAETAKVAVEDGIPRLDCIKVTVCPWLKGRRSQDVGACMRAAKAAVDGLVDAGVLPDDTPSHVVNLSFLPPVLGAEIDELVLTLEVVR